MADLARPADTIESLDTKTEIDNGWEDDACCSTVCLLDSLRRLPAVVRASVPQPDPRIVRERDRQLSGGDWASQAVKDAIKETAVGLIFAGGPW